MCEELFVYCLCGTKKLLAVFDGYQWHAPQDGELGYQLTTFLNAHRPCACLEVDGGLFGLDIKRDVQCPELP